MFLCSVQDESFLPNAMRVGIESSFLLSSCRLLQCYILGTSGYIYLHLHRIHNDQKTTRRVVKEDYALSKSHRSCYLDRVCRQFCLLVFSFSQCLDPTMTLGYAGNQTLSFFVSYTRFQRVADVIKKYPAYCTLLTIHRDDPVIRLCFCGINRFNSTTSTTFYILLCTPTLIQI